MACEFCGGDVRPAHEVYLGGLRSRMMLCESCHAGRVCPPFADDEVERFYQHDYFKALPWELNKAHVLARDYFAKVSAEGGGVAFQGNLLEIGSGFGCFAALVGMLTRSTVDVVEPSKACQEFARNQGVQGECWARLEDMPSGRAVYANVFCFHVVEHLQRLGDFLGEVAKVMMSGGRFWILTPNASSATFRRFGVLWGWSCPGQHYQFISSDIPESFFEQHGFRVASCLDVQPAVIHFPSRWLLQINLFIEELSSRLAEATGISYGIIRVLRAGLARVRPWLEQNRRWAPGLCVERWFASLSGARPHDELFLVLERQ